MAKVLAVDDERQILTALVRGLGRAGHEIVAAGTAHDALAAAATTAPDLVLLDLRLPDLDGIEVVRRLRTWTEIPVVLLSGAGTDRARIDALDAGADDFVDKPFSMGELRARVAAVLRRASASRVAADEARVERHGTRIDLATRRVEVAGDERHLTPTEWKLLAALVRAPGRLLTHRQVITEVWDERHGEEARDSLRAHLRTLRAKLGDDATSPRFIATEPGVGYRWVAVEDG